MAYTNVNKVGIFYTMEKIIVVLIRRVFYPLNFILLESTPSVERLCELNKLFFKFKRFLQRV